MHAQLKVARGSSAGKTFPIDGKQFIVGRATGCHLRPQSDAISRQHCAFIVKGDRLYVKDLGSRNGTYVNEEQLTAAAQLKSGDIVRVGPLVLEVDLSQSDEATQLATETLNVADTPTTSASTDSADEDLISDWLQDLDVDEPEKTTREFSLDATITTTVIRTDDSEPPTDDDKKKKKKKKKEFSKLPDKSTQKAKADTSRDAAADTLRELFYHRDT